MTSLSVLIPCYKESSCLEGLIQTLISEKNVKKQIIVTIDNPTVKSKQLAKKYERDCIFILNKSRLGKVDALNLAAELATGDVLVFLDADTIIKTDNFLSRVKKNMTVDLIEFKKEVPQTSFIARLVKYDYLAGVVCSTMFNKLKKCLGLNGSGFAITRSFFNQIGGFKHVISEDLELGMQVYLQNKEYKYAKNIVIFQHAPKSWKGLIQQRRRWAAGTSEFFRAHKRDVLKVVRNHPQMSLIALYFFFPTLIGTLFFLPFVEQAILLLLVSISLKFPIIFPVVFFATWTLLLFKNLLVFSIIYTITSIMFYIVAKKAKVDFNNREFFIYYLLYSPIYASIFVFYFVISSFKQLELANWKV